MPLVSLVATLLSRTLLRDKYSEEIYFISRKFLASSNDSIRNSYEDNKVRIFVQNIIYKNTTIALFEKFVIDLFLLKIY